MAKLVALTRERRSKRWSQTDYFIVQENVENVEKAMREAVKDYLKTESGKKMIEYSCGDYNWGDAVMSVDEESWNKHGIELKYDHKEYSIIGETIEIIVNQDEVLCDEIDEEEE